MRGLKVTEGPRSLRLDRGALVSGTHELQVLVSEWPEREALVTVGLE